MPYRQAFSVSPNMDGEPVCSCLVPLAQARGARVVTIEGLGAAHPLQRGFVEEGGAQCGMCTPGMIMAALALPAEPSLAQVRSGLAGNLCRCTGYDKIVRAVQAAAEELDHRCDQGPEVAQAGAQEERCLTHRTRQSPGDQYSVTRRQLHE